MSNDKALDSECPGRLRALHVLMRQPLACLYRYAGFDCDYTRYPDPRQAAEFIRHYLAACSTGSKAQVVSYAH